METQGLLSLRSKNILFNGNIKFMEVTYMKVYIVIADNGWSYEEHRWWNVGVFYTREGAERCIKHMPRLIEAGLSQIDAFEMLIDEVGTLTLEQEEKYTRLKKRWNPYWHFLDKGHFRIEERELDRF